MGGAPDVSEDPDVVAILLDVHVCGRHILDTSLHALVDGAGEVLLVQVAGAVLRFLTFNSPLHELDEEQTVFPALRAHAPKDEVETALRHVVDEHAAFDDLRERLARRWEHVRDQPAGLGPLRRDLVKMTEEFVRMLDRHAEHEELVIFPLVRKYVPREVQVQMLAVMLNRRGMGPPGQLPTP